MRTQNGAFFLFPGRVGGWCLYQRSEQPKSSSTSGGQWQKTPPPRISSMLCKCSACKIGVGRCRLREIAGRAKLWQDGTALPRCASPRREGSIPLPWSSSQPTPKPFTRITKEEIPWDMTGMVLSIFGGQHSRSDLLWEVCPSEGGFVKAVQEYCQTRHLGRPHYWPPIPLNKISSWTFGRMVYSHHYGGDSILQPVWCAHTNDGAKQEPWPSSGYHSRGMARHARKKHSSNMVQ